MDMTHRERVTGLVCNLNNIYAYRIRRHCRPLALSWRTRAELNIILFASSAVRLSRPSSASSAASAVKLFQAGARKAESESRPRRQHELTVLDDRRRVEHGFPPIARDSASARV